MLVRVTAITTYEVALQMMPIGKISICLGMAEMTGCFNDTQDSKGPAIGVSSVQANVRALAKVAAP